MIKGVVGGIGDFIQVIPSAMESKYIKVFTHQLCANDFFEPLGVNIDPVKFNTLEELEKDFRFRSLTQDDLLLRSFYLPSSFTIPPQSLKLINDFKKTKKIIGIHPIGSEMSTYELGNRNFPTKNMPVKFVKEIVANKDYDYFIFGTPKELQAYQSQINDNNVIYISYKFIWDSLAHVKLCDKVVAVDSCVKTMSSAYKIFTIVLVGDFEDEFRDEMFLKPYEKDGVIKTIKYNTLNEEHLCQIKEMIV